MAGSLKYLDKQRNIWDPVQLRRGCWEAYIEIQKFHYVTTTHGNLFIGV